MIIIFNEKKRIGNQKHKIEQSEEKYHYLFKKCPIPMAILDNNGVIIDCNNYFLNLTAIKKDEIINRYYEQTILKPIKKLQLFKEDNKLREENAFPDSFELEINKSDYKKIWLELKFNLIILKDKPLLYIIFREITQLKEAERENLRLDKTVHQMNALIEHAPLAIFLMAQFFSQFILL